MFCALCKSNLMLVQRVLRGVSRNALDGVPETGLAGSSQVMPSEKAAVCTENLNPNVLTMKSAQYGARIYDAGSLNLARDRRIIVQ
jgi:hypothetical protein